MFAYQVFYSKEENHSTKGGSVDWLLCDCQYQKITWAAMQPWVSVTFASDGNWIKTEHELDWDMVNDRVLRMRTFLHNKLQQYENTFAQEELSQSIRDVPSTHPKNMSQDNNEL